MIQDKIQKDYPLAELSTYKIGGPAEYFVLAETKQDVEAAFAFAREQQLAVTVLGGGSNILISDTGVKGLIIKLHNQEIDIQGETILCGAGVEVRTIAELAFEKNLSGIEWSIGIPGSMGGAIRGNAGAHGGSFDQVVTKVIVFDAEEFIWREYLSADCDFAYRSSRFKTEPHYIIWEVILSLKTMEDKPAMEKAMNEYREYRRTSQPKEPSAGCIFKNLFADNVKSANPELFARAEAEGKIRGGKIGAGYLIQALNLKGYSVGGAKISEQHANFIVNADHAKAQDVITIAEKVQRDVRAEFGIDLEEEVQRVGF